jgi:carbon-monoxide dehydrogenase small subunit
VLAQACDGRRVRTVEGMATGEGLHPLQEAFADLGAAQCGYCTPGFLLTAQALLDANPSPTRAEIKDALAGNLCRCTGYLKIYEAVELAAGLTAERPDRGTAERRNGQTAERRNGGTTERGKAAEVPDGR